MAAAVCVCSLAGCGGQDHSGQKPDLTEKKTQKEQQEENTGDILAEGSSSRSEETELTISNFNYMITEKFLSAFHEAYPEVKLKVISYNGMNGSGFARRSLEAGDIPDIYLSTQNFSKEAQEQYLIDLSNYDFINHYPDKLLSTQDVNGGIYLLPCGYQLLGINYNKTILEDNGWSVPESFTEFVALKEQIEAAGYQAVGNGMDLDGYPFNFFFSLGNTVYFGTPEGTAWKENFVKGTAAASDNEGLKKSADYFKKWVDSGLITDEHIERREFLEGACVFYIGLGINEYEVTTEDGETYEFGIMPWLSEDGSNNMLTRNVSRRIGISKSLENPGNERKLEDALKVMEYLSTVEGQQALMETSSEMPSLIENEIREDSPYWEISDMVYEGRTAPMVYVDWEELLVPMARKIKLMIDQEVDSEELLASFDRVYEEVSRDDSANIYGRSPQRLTWEATARLAAIAEGKAVDADCAMISLQNSADQNVGNRMGLAWYLYEGDIDADMVNIICPRSSSISVLEMTGAEIKAMRDAGFVQEANNQLYSYILVTKGDIELEDHGLYRLAVSSGELSEDMREQAEEIEISAGQAIEAYVRELGTVSEDVIRWEDTDAAE